MTPAQQRLAKLTQLWAKERTASQERFRALRADVPLKARVAAGIALTDLAVDDEVAVAGGRTLLWLRSRKGEAAAERLAAKVGQPVRLWWDASKGPESDDVCRATIAKRRKGRLGVIVDGEVPEWLADEGFRLDLDNPDATFDRGARALKAFADAAPKHREASLREVLFGEATPRFKTDVPLANELEGGGALSGLNEVQRQAVAHAMNAEDVALIHGPPGTGKTTTLAALVRVAVGQGETVLATAASNMAVDNLAVAMLQNGTTVLRVGHPARISAGLGAHTLDAHLDRSPEMKLARGWLRQAHALRGRIASRRERGRADWAALAGMRDDMRQLFSDARRQMRRAEQRVLAEADVICATTAGADSRILGEKRFGLVVVDEATQATDPIALVALARAERVVLAGDPQQLAPTVLDSAAAKGGLAETLFERLLQTHGEGVCRMLTVQYRMPEALMAFPSASMYEGRLLAHDSVAKRSLADLPGVRPDASRPGPWAYIDTAGKGWDEAREGGPEGRGSWFNKGQAERTIGEVKRAIAHGLAAPHVAVITPYSAQRSLLAAGLSVEVAAGLEVGTVDSFQGQEREAIFVDLVRSNPRGDLGFVADVRRMNVALTRAKRYLCVVADSATFGGHPYFAAFMEEAEAQGAWISAWSDDPSEDD